MHWNELEAGLIHFASNLKKSRLNSSEALEVFKKNTPNSYEVYDRTNINWDKDRWSRHETKAKIALLKHLDSRIPEKIRYYLDFESAFWCFPILSVQYEIRGVSCLKWTARLHVIVDSEVHVREDEYKVLIGNDVFPLYLKDKILGYYDEYLSPKDTGVEPIHLFTTPISLLDTLSEGKMQASGSEVVKREFGQITYSVQDFPDDIVLPDEFIEFVQKLSDGKGLDELLDRMLEIGLLDQITFKIVRGQYEPKSEPVKPAVKLPIMISAKDKERLKKISQVKDYLSYSGWAKVLIMNNREAAFQCLEKLGKGGFITLTKGKQGTKAELTEKGLQAIEE